MTEIAESRGERTRRAILDAAREVVLSQGYTAASMRQIGHAAGVTPAAIYNHFAGKDALFTELLQEAAPLAEMTELLYGLQADSAEALLREAFRGLATIIETHEDYVRLALIDAQERDGATLATFIPRVFPMFLAFAQRLQALDGKSGRLRVRRPAIIVRATVSLMAGYVLTERIARLQAGVLPSMDWQAGLLDVLMYGLFREDEGS